MTALADLRPGDEVMLCDANHAPRKVKIERVGRKYVFIERDDLGFARDTGRRNDRWGNTHIETLNEYAHGVALNDALRFLREIVNDNRARRNAVAIATAVRAVLESPEALP